VEWQGTKVTTLLIFNLCCLFLSVVSLYFEPEQFYCKVEELDSKENGGVAVATGWKVERLDMAEKKAILAGGKEIQFDKCLIATGNLFSTFTLITLFKINVDTRNFFNKIIKCFDQNRLLSTLIKFYFSNLKCGFSALLHLYHPF